MDGNYDSDFRLCKLYGHDRLEYSHICTYKLCDIPRKCCFLCLQYGIHNHSMLNNDHIIGYLQFSETIQKDLKNMQKEFSKNQQEINKEQFLWKLLQNLKKLRMEIEALEQNVEIRLNKFSSRNLFSLLDMPNFEIETEKRESETLNRWIRDELDFEVKQFQDPMNKIQQQINKEQQNLKEFLENKPCQTLQQRKYEIQQIKIDQSDQAIISNNERYLVYNNNKTIFIYDIKLNKISKSIFQKYFKKYGYGYGSFQFELDSQYLFVGDFKGYVYGFSFFGSKDFKLVYKQKIHQDSIQQIKKIQNQTITLSKDGSIIKTDFLTKRCTFKYQIQNDRIQLTFDYDPLNDILLSATGKTIEIWDVQHSSILIRSFEEYILNKVQFVNNNQNILCLDKQEGHLLKYKIDYQNKQLVKLDQYYYHNKIIGFQQFNNDENLLLIFEQCYRILNNQGELVSTIYHFLELNCYELFQPSLHSLNFIALYNRSGNSLHLVKALK